MTDKELRTIAVDTVIKYAAEQGVKLRRSDFSAEDRFHTFFNDDETGVAFVRNGDRVIQSLMVKVAYVGRWEKQLKAAKDRFLDYFNARLENKHLSFSFSVNELEIIAMKRNSAEQPGEDHMEVVIRKINKLLALADQSKNPEENEAIAASLMAQRLLAKYNLSLADVRGERPEEEVEQSIADVGSGKKWKYTLAQVVANNFACKHYIVGHEQIVFYGYQADIIAARRVFMYLFKVGDKLANQYTKRFRKENGYADGVYNSFCKGFAAGVKKELEKQCKALALVVQPKVQEQWDVFSAGFGTMNANVKATNLEAFETGRVEGKRALNAQYIEG